MPGSFDFFNDDVKNFVHRILPDRGTILDVGPGAGKYGKMFQNKYFIDGCEIFNPYIFQYGLENIYRKVYNEDICTFSFPRATYDLVILGDILEHIEVAPAQALVKRLNEDLKASLLILVPYGYHQGVSHGNIHEIHEQPDLTEKIFHERYPGFTKIFGNDKQGVFFKPTTL